MLFIRYEIIIYLECMRYFCCCCFLCGFVQMLFQIHHTIYELAAKFCYNYQAASGQLIVLAFGRHCAYTYYDDVVAY